MMKTCKDKSRSIRIPVLIFVSKRSREVRHTAVGTYCDCVYLCLLASSSTSICCLACLRYHFCLCYHFCPCYFVFFDSLFLWLSAYSKCLSMCVRLTVFFYYQYCLIVVPSPPVNARYLSVTSKAAIIVWSRSLVPNGQLSYYKMHYAAGNKRTCYTSHSNAIRVSGSTEGRLFDLKPSTSYCVWVAAVNIRSDDNQHLISNSSNVLTFTTLTAGALPYFH